ncbi:MAG TPA: NADH-ubiquinone oxidoreductase-F iron-sulfur binding region domain-containing protein [Candidatus Limnocylindrales bacterium]
MIQPRLLAGPPAAAGAETLSDHVARLGSLPGVERDLVRTITASGLLGRGGAAFPVGRKLHAVAARSLGDARLLVNGAEGEPLSAKDRALMASRPHLILDGALLAANAIGAREIVLYVGSAHREGQLALARAVSERRRLPLRVRLVSAPHAYVAGEESAAVHFINQGDARPTVTPPRPFERGIDDMPTLVQNVESLAYLALIARFGEDWYRQAGRGQTPGTALVTVSGAPNGGVREVEMGTRIGEIAQMSGLGPHDSDAVLLGGYFGRWTTRDLGWALPLDPVLLQSAGAPFGTGVLSFLGMGQCGVAATAAILDYMAAQSAAQCGPCVFGLRSIADTTRAVASEVATSSDLGRLERWAGQIDGRGACRHPDGAVGLLLSAMTAFAADFETHSRRSGCLANVARPSLEVAA